ncbi:MAG: thiol peroxidase [Vampirovibrionales bacterium]
MVTFKGNTIELAGQAPKVGQAAPNFELLNNGLQPVTLADFAGKNVLLNIVPSLDTPVCQIQSKTFYVKLQQSPVSLVTVSMDLPFAQARFCGAENLDAMQSLSDHRTGAFGEAFGVLIPSLQLLSRAVVLIDAQGVVQYVEVVDEVTQEPNYDACMKAIEALVAQPA